MNFDFYHNYILQSYCCNLYYILAYLLFSVSNKSLPLPLLRMDTRSGCVSSDSTTNLSTRCGSLCHSSQPPPPSVCIQIPKSRSDGNGCIPLRLESVEELDLRTTCPSTEDYPEDQAGQGDGSDIGASLERPIMVPKPPRATDGLSTTVTADPTLDHPSISAREGTSASTLTTVDCIWPVSGSVTAQTDFRRRLRRFYCHPGETPHKNATLGHGTLGQAGVLHGLSVPLQPL